MRRFYDLLPVPGQNLACTVAGLQRAQRRFTPHFFRMLALWERTVEGPVEELCALQALRLAALLDHAREHVPFYRELPPMVLADEPEEAIRRTLDRIPPLEKKVYRDDSESFLSRKLAGHGLIRGRTSGTTGTALTLWYTPEALAEEYATVWRMRRRLGARIRDPHLTFGGQIVVPFTETSPPFWRTDWYTHNTLFSPYHMKPENLPAYVDALHRAPARYVQGYPSSLHLVARAMLDAGRPFEPGRLSAVFTSSESLLAFQKETIEKAFGAPIFDRYGASEFAVSMTACPEGRLHVDMEYCIVEVESVEETSEYVRGPLIVTGLGNEAVPFIRYRIGDLGTRWKRACPCGRPGEVFLEVDGRIEDYVETPDGRLVGRLDHIFKEQRDVAEAQILQESKDAIRILVVPQADYGPASEAQLRREVHSRLGPEIAISIEPVGSIPREPNGKLRAVKSNVQRRAA